MKRETHDPTFMKTILKKSRGFTLVELLVVITIIAALAGIATPQVFKQLKKADMSVATANAKQIGIAMLEFSVEYGSYPSKTSETLLNENFSDSVIKGGSTTSNDYFKQLFQSGIVQSEEIFYAKAKNTIKPDGNISTDANALKAGEVGFAYFINNDSGLSSSSNPSLPVVVSPLSPGSSTSFDPEPFDKKVIMLRVDTSVVSQNITVPTAGQIGNSTGTVVASVGTTANAGVVKIAGFDILSAANPIWPAGSNPQLIAPRAIGSK